MAKAAYELVFADAATDFILQLSGRRQMEVVDRARQLSEHPFVRSDYRLSDDSGRDIEHLLVDSYVFAYWLDHAAREIRIVDIEDAT